MCAVRDTWTDSIIHLSDFPLHLRDHNVVQHVGNLSLGFQVLACGEFVSGVPSSSAALDSHLSFL